MQTYIHRKLEKTLKKYISIFPIVGIIGPRQSGKSSLLKEIFGKEYSYVTFDDLTTINLFYDDPEKFMRINSNRVIFDEAHKAPEIFNYIKLAVDNDRSNYGKFIITGSAQFLLMKNISESLAGRIGLLTLLPFEVSEIQSYLTKDTTFRGGYPELVLRNYYASEEWFASYIDTYLQKDLRLLSNIGDIRDFNRMIRLLAARTAQILNLSEISKELGIAVSTVKRWISVLEISFIIFLLPPFYDNLGKRIIKSPKIYFYDTGLVSYLTGISNYELYAKGPMSGSIFENFVVSEILKKEKHSDSKAELFYLRTNHGVEVDLIIDRKITRQFIEIKNSETFRPQMAKSIEILMPAENRNGLVLYNGEDITYSERIKATSYENFLLS